MFYCRICRRNDNKKHVYTNAHHNASSAFTQKQILKVSKLLSKEKEPPFWCIFCDVNIDTIEHLASTDHEAKTRKFCQIHRCKFTKAFCADMVSLSSCSMPESTSIHDTTTVSKNDDEEEKEAVKQRTRRLAVEAVFLNSASSQLHFKVHKDVCHAPVMSNAECMTHKHKTIFSKDNQNAQNPSGWDGASRAWSGGIVKVPKHDWISRPIDHIMNTLQQPRQQQRVALHDDYDRRRNIRRVSMEGPNRFVTDLAYGHGLSSIKRTWDVNVPMHNVHSGAVPPWLVHSKEEYYQCNRFQAHQSREMATPLTHVNKSSSSSFSSSSSSSWLPKFGSVWVRAVTVDTICVMHCRSL
jgi:hypothetical protein